MKTIRILVLALTLTFPGQGSGQVFRIGPTAGISVSKMTNDSAHAVTGVTIGGSYVFNLSQHVIVEGGLGYLRKGGDWKRTDKGVYQFAFSERLHYAEAPVILSWFFNDDKDRFRPSAGLGITPSYMISGARLQQYNDLSNGFSTDIHRSSVDKKYKRWDIGITGTAGVNYRTKSRHWLAARIGCTAGQLPFYYMRGLKKVTHRHMFINASWQIPVGEYTERGYVLR
jgi:hypothetical protein